MDTAEHFKNGGKVVKKKSIKVNQKNKQSVIIHINSQKNSKPRQKVKKSTQRVMTNTYQPQYSRQEPLFHHILPFKNPNENIPFNSLSGRRQMSIVPNEPIKFDLNRSPEQPQVLINQQQPIPEPLDDKRLIQNGKNEPDETFSVADSKEHHDFFRESVPEDQRIAIMNEDGTVQAAPSFMNPYLLSGQIPTGFESSSSSSSSSSPDPTLFDGDDIPNYPDQQERYTLSQLKKMRRNGDITDQQLELLRQMERDYAKNSKKSKENKLS